MIFLFIKKNQEKEKGKIEVSKAIIEKEKQEMVQKLEREKVERELESLKQK